MAVISLVIEGIDVCAKKKSSAIVGEEAPNKSIPTLVVFLNKKLTRALSKKLGMWV